MVMQVHDNYLTNTSHIEVYQGSLTTIKMQLVFFQAADKVISDPHCPRATMPPPTLTNTIDSLKVFTLMVLLLAKSIACRFFILKFSVQFSHNYLFFIDCYLVQFEFFFKYVSLLFPISEKTARQYASLLTNDTVK